jgi:hypothetical protein
MLRSMAPKGASHGGNRTSVRFGAEHPLDRSARGSRLDSLLTGFSLADGSKLDRRLTLRNLNRRLIRTNRNLPRGLPRSSPSLQSCSFCEHWPGAGDNRPDSYPVWVSWSRS